jgi:hypothetical protein
MTPADLIDRARRAGCALRATAALVAMLGAPVWLVLAWAWTHPQRERGR